MKTFQVNVNADVQSFMVDIKKIGISENNDFDKVVMTWLKQLINGKCYASQKTKKKSKFDSQMMYYNLIKFIIIFLKKNVSQSHGIVTHHFGTKFWKKNLRSLTFLLIETWQQRLIEPCNFHVI